MSDQEYIKLANEVLIQHFARTYLSPNRTDQSVAIAGASLQTRCISNRASVPAAAVTVSTLVEHPELGFSFRFRAVWFNGSLLTPTATHVVIEKIWDEGEHGSQAAVCAAINEWLQAVTP